MNLPEFETRYTSISTELLARFAKSPEAARAGFRLANDLSEAEWLCLGREPTPEERCLYPEGEYPGYRWVDLISRVNVRAVAALEGEVEGFANSFARHVAVKKILRSLSGVWHEKIRMHNIGSESLENELIRCVRIGSARQVTDFDDRGLAVLFEQAINAGLIPCGFDAAWPAGPMVAYDPGWVSGTLFPPQPKTASVLMSRPAVHAPPRGRTRMDAEK